MALESPDPAVHPQAVWKTLPIVPRLAGIGQQLLRERLDGVLRASGFRSRGDRPRVQPLRSDHGWLRRWRAKPFGDRGKPRDLGEIDWDYVAAHEHEIPFKGLREYWYPAVTSRELRHNTPLAQKICGDNIVFFRGADGAPAAIEDRCPHRGPLLSLGQVGAFEAGTITCRYHGMTFDPKGDCIAVIGDGPDSPACGAVKAKTYPTREYGGVVWIYMGDNDPPDLLESLPYGREVLEDRDVFLHRVDMPFSYLNALDNDVDMSHPSCLHRSCLPFASQRAFVRVGYEDLPGRGVLAYTATDDGKPDTTGAAHDGLFHVRESQWFPPNIAYFALGSIGMGDMLGDEGEIGYFWAVPNDVAHSTGWLIFSQPYFRNPLKRWMTRFFHHALHGTVIRFWGSNLSCISDADAVMMMAQGRIANWDRDNLLRVDVAMARVREQVKALHREEVARNPDCAIAVPPHYRRQARGDSGVGAERGATEPERKFATVRRIAIPNAP